MKTKTYVKPLTGVLPIEEDRSFCDSLGGGGGTIEPIEEGELE